MDLIGEWIALTVVVIGSSQMRASLLVIGERRSTVSLWRGGLRLSILLRWLLAEGNRFGTLVARFRHHDSHLFFKPLGHQPPMAPHVDLSNLCCLPGRAGEPPYGLAVVNSV